MSESTSPTAAALNAPSKKKNKKGGSRQPRRPIKFGTFKGVFTPTLLTILGVIMYVRSPWVVGNAGVLGAIGIITLATAITFFTALSMSSIVTNIRIKAGGPFAIISQSLGLEAGGAIGIPLFVAQAFAVAMYVFGFREGWLWIFPDHPAILVDLATFIVIFGIANVSANFAFKLQYVILAIIILSLISIGMGFINHPVNSEIRLFGNYEGAPENNFSGINFWIVFAVYFPAVTGVMVGANMSGELKDPRKSIPQGTLAAIGLTYLIYVAISVAIAFLATPRELLENYNVLIDKSFFAPIVLAALLGATFSSGLSSIVGAPRILQAMGQNNILYKNKQLARLDSKGEPKVAFYITCIIVLLALLMRDLNAIAPIITMFFLITYAMINVVVLVEQALGQISFRPTIKIPLIVPLLGAVGCFFVMFIVNPTVGLVSIGIVVAMYIYLTGRTNLERDEGDTRSGMFNSLAEWSAKVVTKLPEARERSWQPNLLVPAQTVNDVVRSYKTIYNLARPKGSVKILGFDTAGERDTLQKRLPELCDSFMAQGISATHAIVHADSFVEGMLTSMQSLKASFFRPNTLFLSMTDQNHIDRDVISLSRKAREYGFGAYLYVPYQKVGLGLEKTINFWIDLDQVDPELKYKVENVNIGLLTAYLLKRNWKGELHIIAVTRDESAVSNWAKRYMERLMTLARMPKDAKLHFAKDMFDPRVKDLHHADLNILVLQPDTIRMEEIRQQARDFETSLLYTIDSGVENALA